MYFGGNLTETNTEATATYYFEISYNRTGLVIGGITVAQKYGWDVISPTFKTTTNNGRKVKQLSYIEIIRPAGRAWVDYKPIFGWG